jgi:hypothetical protein
MKKNYMQLELDLTSTFKDKRLEKRGYNWQIKW